MKLSMQDWVTLYKLLNELRPNEVGDRMANIQLNNALAKIFVGNTDPISEIEELQDKADRESMAYKQELLDCEKTLANDPGQAQLIARKAELANILNMLQAVHLLSVEKIFQNEKMEREVEIKLTKQEKEALVKQFDAFGLRLLNRSAYIAISQALV